MKGKQCGLFSFLLLFKAATVSCFVVHRQEGHLRISPRSIIGSFRTPPSVNNENSFLSIRGGEIPLEQETGSALSMTMTTMTSLTSSSLQAGPYGILALTAIAFLPNFPLTLYKQLYAISVGYGASMFAIGLALYRVFKPVTLLEGSWPLLLMVYGVRLSGYLFLREKTRKDSWTPASSTSSNETKTITGAAGVILKRLQFAISVSLFYALMCLPVLSILRLESNPGGSAIGSSLFHTGALGFTALGLLIESVADFQKYFVKQKASKADLKEKVFAGPTGLTYAICRHPNYLGEIMFWMGIYLGGLPYFWASHSILGWLASSLGLFGIVSIMLKATDRLEKRHKEQYSGQELYDGWTQRVKKSLVPLIF